MTETPYRPHTWPTANSRENTQTYRHADTQIHTHTHSQPDRQTDRQTHTHTQCSAIVGLSSFPHQKEQIEANRVRRGVVEGSRDPPVNFECVQSLTNRGSCRRR